MRIVYVVYASMAIVMAAPSGTEDGIVARVQVRDCSFPAHCGVVGVSYVEYLCVLTSKLLIFDAKPSAVIGSASPSV